MTELESNRRTQVVEWMQNLHNSAVENEEIISMILDRLGRVTIDSAPNATCKDGPTQELVPLAAELRAISERIDDSTARLRITLDSLEL
jgi:hypothetical protein